MVQRLLARTRTTGLRMLRSRIRKGGTQSLLASLLLLIVITPLPEKGAAAGVLTLFASLIVLAGVYAVATDRRHFLIACILGIPALLGEWVALIVRVPLLELASTVLAVPFYAYVIITVLSHVLREGEVSLDRMYGAVAVYLLMGLAWGAGFAFIESVRPGSFFIAAALNPDGVLSGADLLYYSFVTLTTSGFGDIVPASSLARTLSILEAVGGVMYVAILVSRLAGLIRLPGRTTPGG
ncbi:MAG: two pore domain potassium channel family protein [Candidatus Aenigmarchaeota archaeon]|nr:two pore domain potassium channel family protein [Candidatus Aenigmarchaeota archaeon]